MIAQDRAVLRFRGAPPKESLSLQGGRETAARDKRGPTNIGSRSVKLSVLCAAPMRAVGWLRCLGLVSLLVAMIGGAGPACAQGSQGQESVQLLARPIEYTDVLDAFEHGALPDFRVRLRFARSQSAATVMREHTAAGDRAAGRRSRVAHSRQVTNALTLELAAGLWSDLMLYGRLPVVLSNMRSLSARGSLDPGLFGVPYRSITRSGIPAVDFGLAWGVVNQYRTPHWPTWVVSVEAELGLGKLLRPCTQGSGCSSGVNRGTAAITVESRWSYRLRWLEPFLGLRYRHEWATAAADNFAPHADVRGYRSTSLPSVQELTLGAALLTWEDRARYQRLSVELSGMAAYVSAGRDYSVLYDALGTSQDPQLATPYESESGQVPFTGITNVGSHTRLGAELSLVMQAARYMRFRLGVALSHTTAHALTQAVACEGDGSCSGQSVNLLYRPAIDSPGQRFWQVGEVRYDLFVGASGEF